MENILRQITCEYIATVLGRSYCVPFVYVLLKEILWIRLVQMQGVAINFHISPHIGITEKSEETTASVSNSLLRLVVIPKLDQVLVQVSPEHLQG